MATETQDHTGAGGQPPPMKFSRYRSVRRAASSNAQGMAPPNTSFPPVPTHSSAPAHMSHDASDWTSGSTTTIKKSMSRYRRQKPSTPNSTSDVPPVPFLPISPQQNAIPQAQPAMTPDNYPPPRPSKDLHKADVTKRGRFVDAMRLDTGGRGLIGGNGNTSSDTEREERERDRQAAMASLTGGVSESPVAPPSRQKPTTRGRAATDREGHKLADNQHQVDNDASRRHSHNETKRKSFKEAMRFSRPKEKARNGPSIDGGTDANAAALFPGIDAPVSAVNAGERRVLVQYKKDSLKLSVSPSTSAHDILVSASRSISEVDPPRFILMESFTSSGLERPLRQYEYVRDVMNSWAHDAENALIIVPAPSIDALSVLRAQRVPTKPPMDATFHIYHSQRPRKWDKRYLTLQSDGQITLSKKEIAKEQTNICHLSDFDIYSPTSTFLSQKVRPPKKICYAIKSQQKSSMFLSSENFIHFFATNDKSIADGWYRAVQTWRSWYLVNKLGAGQLEGNVESEARVSWPQDRSFKPLLATIDNSDEENEGPLVDRARTRQISSRRGSSREHNPPPSSFSKSLANELETAAAQSADESPFSAAGLLGRTYTLRQKALKERDDREKKEAEVLFNQGLVGAMTAQRQFSASRPGSRTSSMTAGQPPDMDGLMKRSQSAQQGKPLVDLTPVYQEAPQHTRKGRGVVVDTGLPLIDGATGLDQPGGIAIPPAKTWRRPTMPSEPPSTETRTRNRSNTARSASSRYRHQNTATTPSSPAPPVDLALAQEQAFVPNTLLARTETLPPAQGAQIGHGVATGDRHATKPMLDMSPQSLFAEGSLLRGL
ncbi:hypothetical protein BDW59DRAFT_149841 [Aspergillus cavernicola]|uniref:PH domain-containing protein n=1 Tax=Aspergillus cavernicola TaxID=176166 RepID=A0ABR4I2H5_9EURO